jgi:hypothetical protein
MLNHAPVAVPQTVPGKVKPDGPSGNKLSKGAAKKPGVPAVTAAPELKRVALAEEMPDTAATARLREQVERACGVGARDVRVLRRSASDLLVQFKVRNEAEAEQLAERVLSMPELAPYHLDLDVSVAE